MPWFAEMTKLSFLKSGRLSRGNSFGLIGIFQLVAFVATSQTWFEVTMNPNDETVTLQSFDGYSTYPWISPLLVVCLASSAVGYLTKGKTRVAMFVTGATSAFFLTSLAAIGVLSKDLSGVAKQLETATGIAATHGISGLGVSTQPVASLSVVCFLFLGTLFLFAAISQKYWVVKSPVTQTASPSKEPKTAIDLWDEQR
jgi:hypothetical protein